MRLASPSTQSGTTQFQHPHNQDPHIMAGTNPHGTRKRKNLHKPDGMSTEEHWRIVLAQANGDEDGEMVPTAVDDVVVPPSLPADEEEDGDEDYKVEDGEDESESEDEDSESVESEDEDEEESDEDSTVLSALKQPEPIIVTGKSGSTHLYIIVRVHTIDYNCESSHKRLLL